MLCLCWALQSIGITKHLQTLWNSILPMLDHSTLYESDASLDWMQSSVRWSQIQADVSAATTFQTIPSNQAAVPHVALTCWGLSWGCVCLKPCKTFSVLCHKKENCFFWSVFSYNRKALSTGSSAFSSICSNFKWFCRSPVCLDLSGDKFCKNL